MSPLRPWPLFALLLAAPLRAGHVEVPVGEVRLGNTSGAPGASLLAPAPLSLTVSPLTSAPLSPALALSAPAPSLQAAAIPALAAPAAVGAKPTIAPAIAPAVSQNHPAAAAGQATPDDFDASGRAMFDQAGAKDEYRPVSTGFVARLKNMLSLGEAAPAWPGRAGETVRVGGIKTALDKPIGAGNTSKVWKSRDGNYAIKLLHPQARATPGAAEEASVLRAVSGRGLPVAELRAVSADGSVLVKDLIEGESAAAIFERKVFARQHELGWHELAAKLIKSGLTADLSPANLVWQTWRSRWMIVDAGGLKDGGPGEVLAQLLSPAALAGSGLDAATMLGGLRGRLGPDSKEWARSRAALKADAGLAVHLAALEARDASVKAPALVFSPAPRTAGGLDDLTTTAGEVTRRLGFDPYRVKTRIKLHGEDPGKLNTNILSLEEPGKPKIILKEAGWDIIRDEVAARRLAKRFFGRYFRVPASLGVNRGMDSYMVMEKADAGPAYYATPLNLEQRVAVALFVHTFGIGDVNPGNVLSPSDGGLPWLIDFEQAFGRHQPVHGRLPDERIAQEMPWMSRQVLNRAEDYQPAIRAWRELLAKPETGAAITADLVAAGYKKAEAEALLARFQANAADLDWSIQNDVDFVNHFVERNAARNR